MLSAYRSREEVPRKIPTNRFAEKINTENDATIFFSQFFPIKYTAKSPTKVRMAGVSALTESDLLEPVINPETMPTNPNGIPARSALYRTFFRLGSVLEIIANIRLKR